MIHEHLKVHFSNIIRAKLENFIRRNKHITINTINPLSRNTSRRYRFDSTVCVLCSVCLPLGEKQRHVFVRGGGAQGKFDPSEAHSPPFRAATISVMADSVAGSPDRLIPWVGEQGLNLRLCLS